MNRTVVLLSLAIFAFASFSASAVFKYEFEGFVYDIGDRHDHELDIDYYQTFAGWFSFSVNKDREFNHLASIFVDFGNYQMASIYEYTNIHLHDSDNNDEFFFDARNGKPSPYQFEDFSLYFEDLTGTAFDSKYLTKPLKLLDFDHIGLNLRGRENIEGVMYDYQKHFNMRGVITDLTFVNGHVPEPCTVAMLGLGGLVLRRRK